MVVRSVVDREGEKGSVTITIEERFRLEKIETIKITSGTDRSSTIVKDTYSVSFFYVYVCDIFHSYSHNPSITLS